MERLGSDRQCPSDAIDLALMMVCHDQEDRRRAGVVLLDPLLLTLDEVYQVYTDYQDVAGAIRRLELPVE
jgi:hypothetical protein